MTSPLSRALISDHSDQKHVTSVWFPNRRPVDGDHVRLVCFPFAGGTASAFREWPAYLPGIEVCAVELPGHGRRMREAPLATLAEMVLAIAEPLGQLPEMPSVFFGHSMGAHVAHRLAFWQEQRGQSGPSWVIVSASRPPRPPRPRSRWRSELPEERFLSFLRRLGGLSNEFLDEPDLVDLMLPVLRNDFKALESLPYASPMVLSASIAAFSGRDDPAARPIQMQGWSEQTAGRFRTQEFDGGHFYIDANHAFLMQSLAPILEDVRSRL